MKQRQHRHTGPYEPQTITRAVTHIRLEAANAGKLAALDALAPVYLALCQQYVTLFCTDEHPDKFYPPVFATSLSERWGDDELRACMDRKAVKALLLQRHGEWKTHNGWP